MPSIPTNVIAKIIFKVFTVGVLKELFIFYRVNQPTNVSQCIFSSAVFSPPNCVLHIILCFTLSYKLCLFILGTHGTMTSWREKKSLSVCDVAIETGRRFCQFARIWKWWTPVLHSFETCEIWRLRGYLQRDYKSTSNMTWTSIKDQRLTGAEGSGTDSLIIVCLFKCSYIKKLHNRYRHTRGPVSWFRYCRLQLCLTDQLYDKEGDMTIPLTMSFSKVMFYCT